jgi:hypothetical protein
MPTSPFCHAGNLSPTSLSRATMMKGIGRKRRRGNGDPAQ